MRRSGSFFLSLFCAVVLLMSMLPLKAEAASASFSGSSSPRAGNTVTLTLSVSGSNIYGVQGNISYDSSVLELVSVNQSAGSGWESEMSGMLIMVYDNSLSHPISNAAVFTVTLRVKSSVSAGTRLSASVTNLSITVPSGSQYTDESLGSASWNGTVAAPLNGNANLTALSCANGALSPAFDSNTTSYSITVPYEVQSLDLNYSRADSGARVSVSGNTLVVGANTVTLTVTAENGAQKQYYIAVTRQQDPNYKASTNTMLSSLHLSAGTLSPAFSPTVQEYVAYVPFEVKDITLSGVAADAKALQVKGVSSFLKPGDNPLTVVCTAEDGVTTGAYTVHVYRMPFYAGVLPEVIPSDNDPATPVVAPVAPEMPTESALLPRAANLAKAPVSLPWVSQYIGSIPAWTLFIATLAVLLLLFYVLGTLVGKTAGRKKALSAQQVKRPEQNPAAKEEAPAERPQFPRVPPQVERDVETVAAPVAEVTDVVEAVAETEAADAAKTTAAPEAEAVTEAETETPDTAQADDTADASAEEKSETSETSDAPAEEAKAVSDGGNEADDLVRTMSLDDLLKDIRNM